MMRRHFTFPCAGFRLAGTLDAAPGATGLLIVSGGNEVRAGPWGSQARLAARIANAGFPVMRFDRRGVGDSEGANGTFAGSGPDLGAAVRAFREHAPDLRRIVAYGNCDAASALMLNRGAGCDALVLANPWTFEPEHAPAPAGPSGQMPPSALRGYYLRRLFNPAAWKRLLRGKVKVGDLAGGLIEAAGSDAPPGRLAQEMAGALQQFAGPVAFLLADNDRTAQAFRAVWNRTDPRIRTCPGAGHSFAGAEATAWLDDQILSALRSA